MVEISTAGKVIFGILLVLGIITTVLGATLLLANRHYEPWKAKQEFFLISTFLLVAGFFYCVLADAVFDF